MITNDQSALFNLAPIAMWLEDFSGVKRQLQMWKDDGVNDIRAFLNADLSRVAACAAQIQIIAVNPKTLELFGATDQAHLVESLGQIFRGEMLESHINELSALFDGKTEFSGSAVNYTIDGQRLDIQLRGVVMPGYEDTLERILLTTEDVTERESARRNEVENRRYAEGIFQHSPVSLWVEDFSRIKIMLEDLRDRGIVDFRVFTDNQNWR